MKSFYKAYRKFVHALQEALEKQPIAPCGSRIVGFSFPAIY
jgi:hypothetical protein